MAMFDSTDDAISLVGRGFTFIFSWVVLMPIAVIVGGKLLSQVLKLSGTSKQVLRVPIPGLLEIQATGAEVILGFTGFIITLSTIGLPAGPRAYNLFRGQFGIDPGHFNSLCVLSSFANVIWSFIVFLLVRAVAARKGNRDSVLKEHEQLIRKIANKGRERT